MDLLCRWDLSGGSGSVSGDPAESRMKSSAVGNDEHSKELPSLEGSLINTLSHRPTRVLDYFFLEAAVALDQQHGPKGESPQMAAGSSEKSRKESRIDRETSSNSPPIVSFTSFLTHSLFLLTILLRLLALWQL